MTLPAILFVVGVLVGYGKVDYLAITIIVVVLLLMILFHTDPSALETISCSVKELTTT